MHERIHKVVRIRIIGAPAAQEQRILKTSNLDDIVLQADAISKQIVDCHYHEKEMNKETEKIEQEKYEKKDDTIT